MIRRAIAMCACMCALASCAAPLPKSAPDPLPVDAIPAVTGASAEDRRKLWLEDLEVFGELYRNNFVGVFVEYPPAEFEADLAKVKEHAGRVSDQVTMYELKKIATRTHCGHAGVDAQRGALLERRMPYQLRAFDDGVFVVATDEKNADLLGAQVLKVGGCTAEEAIVAAASLTPSESEAWTRMRAPDQLSKRTALEVLGLARSDGGVSIEFRDRAGVVRTVAFEELPTGVWPTVPVVRIDSPRAPRTWQPRATWYGSEWLDPVHEVLVVWYDRCNDSPSMTVNAFIVETLKVIDESRPKRVILDLRRNGGGNSALLAPFIAGLAKREWINRPDRLVVLVGPGTFSSGAMNAEQLRRDTKATFIGAPTGSRPKAWMEVRSIVLPNSLLRISYMLRGPRWDSETPKSFEPDVRVEVRSADLFEYRDPAFERAVKLEAK